MASCGNDSELEKLQAENDSLKNVANESQIQLDEFMSAFNDIQENLNTIKQKEHIIELNAVDSSEMTPDMKNQINDDILTIYELMQENKQALDVLKNQLKSSGVKNKQLEQTIALYEQQMTQKDSEISALKEKLEDMNFNMQELNSKIDNMQANLDTMKQVQQQQNDVINSQDAALHKAYYVIGTKDELKDKNVLTRDGVLSGLSLDADFDKSYFTQIDYRNLTEIPLNVKKIEILTNHPSSSYSLVENNGVISKIKITNQEQFWSLSKFLVVVLK